MSFAAVVVIGISPGRMQVSFRSPACMFTASTTLVLSNGLKPMKVCVGNGKGENDKQKPGNLAGFSFAQIYNQWL